MEVEAGCLQRAGYRTVTLLERPCKLTNVVSFVLAGVTFDI